MLGFDPVQFGKAMGELIFQATEPLRLEIERLKEKQTNSKILDSVAIGIHDKSMEERIIASEARCDAIEVAIAALPEPMRGEDGKSVTVDDVMPALSELVKNQISDFEDQSVAKIDRVISDMPTPKDGKDGTSVTIDDVRPILEAEVAKWALDFERRAQGILERAVANMPKPKDGRDGRDGIDGLCFDDTEIEHDGERGFTVRMSREGRVKEKHIKIPVPIDKGYWKEGFKAEAGDGMTCGGSYWIAKCDTTGKPGVSEDWRLAVKKGRDGKDR